MPTQVIRNDLKFADLHICLKLPREATDFFGDLLFPYVENILKSSATKSFDEKEAEKLGDVVAGAVITSNGKLTPKFEYIAELREKNSPKILGDFGSDRFLHIFATITKWFLQESSYPGRRICECSCD